MIGTDFDTVAEVSVLPLPGQGEGRGDGPDRLSQRLLISGKTVYGIRP